MPKKYPINDFKVYDCLHNYLSVQLCLIIYFILISKALTHFNENLARQQNATNSISLKISLERESNDTFLCVT